MEESSLLLEKERIDDLERSDLKIIQNPEKFCFGIDAVLLSGYAAVRTGECALDIGTGTGIVPLLLTAKTEGEHFTGLEIQQYMADMASRSVLLNGLSDRVSIICADVNRSSEYIKSGSMDVITCNPPYLSASGGLHNPDEALNIARHEVCCTLEDVVREGSRMLKSGGRYYMVHRPSRLADIICTMRKYRLEPKRLRMVHPFAGKDANLVLIESFKDGGREMKVERPLVVYERPGVYTEETLSVYYY